VCAHVRPHGYRQNWRAGFTSRGASVTSPLKLFREPNRPQTLPQQSETLSPPVATLKPALREQVEGLAELAVHADAPSDGRARQRLGQAEARHHRAHVARRRVRTAPGLAANAPAEERWKNAAIDEEAARKNIQPIQTPVLILVGTTDGLIRVDRILHDRLAQAGKSVRMEIYENGYHDFCIGPQGQAGRKEPLLDATLDALEKTLAFARDPK